MEKRLQAIYRDGVFRPLQKPQLEDFQQVTLTIDEPAAPVQDASGYFSPEEWAQATVDPITLEEVRQALASIPDSLSDTVIALREER